MTKTHDLTLASGPMLAQTEKAAGFAHGQDHIVWVPKSMLTKIPHGDEIVWAWPSFLKVTPRKLRKREDVEDVIFHARVLGSSEKAWRLELEDGSVVWAPKAVTRELEGQDGSDTGGSLWSIPFSLAAEKGIKPHIET